jgi:hypothetical protein
VALAVGLSSLWSAPAAAAQSPTQGPSASPTAAEHDVLRWAGTLVLSATNPDSGVTQEIGNWSGVVVAYRCAGTVCDLTVSGGVSSQGALNGQVVANADRDFSALPLDATGGFTREFPAEGDPCVDDNQAVATSHGGGSLEPNTAVVTFASDPWTKTCADGSTVADWASAWTFTGSYLSGDPCVLHGGACLPRALAAAAPSPSAAPSSEVNVPAAPVRRSTSGSRLASVSRLASGAVAAPSVLSALTPVQDSKVGLLDVCMAVVVTLILSLLVAFPKKLFSSAIGAAPKRWVEYRDWLRKRDGAAARRWNRALEYLAGRVGPSRGRAKGDDQGDDREVDDGEADDAVIEEAEPNHAVLSGPWRRAALGVVLAGVISSFVDPGFGFNWGSLRVAVSLSASFVLTVVVGWGVAIRIARRFAPGLAASYSFKPFSLVIVALTVVFTRVTGMQPGMVFGLVAGVALGAMSSKATEARVAVAQTGYAFIVGVAGWLAYSALVPAFSGSHNVFAALLVETLSGLSVAGFAAAPLALLPVAGMGGATVFEWSPRAWFAIYSAGLVGFFVVLMPMSYSWSAIDFSLKAWVSLYVAYAAASLSAYMALVRPWRGAREAGAEAIEAESVEADVG